MNPAAKLAGFAVILVACFGAAFGLGRIAAEPDGQGTPPVPTATTVATTTTMDHGGHS